MTATPAAPREFEIVIDGQIFWADYLKMSRWNIQAGTWGEDGPRIGRISLTEQGEGFKAETMKDDTVKIFPIVHFREAVAWLASQHQA